MKKRIVCLMLLGSMLLSMLPVLALPAVAAAPAVIAQSSFVQDHRVQLTADPMTYEAWAKVNSGLDASSATFAADLATYMAGAAAQKAFTDYMLTQGQVIWSGDWAIGNIHNTTGAYEPIAYHTFFEGADWTNWKKGTWYATKSAQMAFLEKFFAKASNSLWGLANVAYVADFSAINQVCFSAKDKAYASYTYTVPAGKSGTATLSLLDERMTLSSNTRLCIMKNDTVVWPEGADLRTPTSWATDLYNSMDAISRLGALTLPVEEGDRIHFVVAGKDGEYVKLNPSVTIAEGSSWQPSESVYLGNVTLPINTEAYAAWCARALDANAESSKQAYTDYVLNDTRLTWTGPWSAGAGTVKDGRLVYEPIAYTFYHTKTWADAIVAGTGAYMITKSLQESVLATYLTSSTSKVNLWGYHNTVYGRYLNSEGAPVGLCNCTANIGTFVWTYTVPADVSELKPAMHSIGYLYGSPKGTGICILKNGVPVWPTGAKADQTDTWANQASQGWAGVAPTVAELNKAFTDVKIPVAEGDQIMFAVIDKQADKPYNYQFSVVNTDTDTTSTYDPHAVIKGEVPVSYHDFCKANSPVRIYGSAMASSNESKLAYLRENAAAFLMTYEEFCQQPLDPSQAVSQQAYRDYVLNETAAITWTGNWSVGESSLTNGTYTYDPIAYHLYHWVSDWDQAGAGSDRYVTAKAMGLFVDKYLSDNDKGADNLWGGVNTKTVYAQSWGQAGIRSLLNNAGDGTVLTWAYTVPAGVSTVVPSITTAAMAQSWQYPNNTRLCIMKNGVPVWPAGATADAGTWATQASQGWAGVRPSAAELNAAWAAVSFDVQEGDRISFCIRDGAADRAYDYRFAVNGEAYDPTAFAEKAAPVSYRAYCNNEAQPLDASMDATKQAYRDYVLSETAAITWTGPWSAGKMLLAGAAYTYEPLAYRLPFHDAKWDTVADLDHGSGSIRYVSAKDMLTFLDKYMTGDGSHLLWSVSGAVYGQETKNTNGINNLVLVTGNKNAMTWAYTVPAGTTKAVPSVTTAAMAQSWHYPTNTRLCVMKNGVPVWPSGATTDPATWATQASQGWAKVNPSADELNAAWAAVSFDVQEGDLITFCIVDNKADCAYDYRFAINGEAYDPQAYTEQDLPFSYQDYCAQGEPVRGKGSSYVTKGYAKDAFISYYLEKLALPQTGDWSLGQVTDSGFAPLSTLVTINGKTGAGGYVADNGLIATTEAGIRALLADYLSGKAVDLAALSGHGLFRLQAEGKYNVLGASGAVASYRYTMPQDGRVRLSIAEASAFASSTTYLCVKHNGKVIWPTSATADQATWATLTASNLASLNETLSAVTPYANKGEAIDFCITTHAPAYDNAAMLLPRVEIYSPLASLFELQGAPILGSNFGATFYATYASKTVADTATVSFTVGGKTLTAKTADVQNSNGTLTRTYTLTGFAAKELTDEITYTFRSETAGEKKTVNNKITIAALLARYLQVEEDRVNTEDALSALALATLNYAAAAQAYFGYKTESPANAAVPESARTPAITVNERTLTEMVYRKTEGATIHFTQASLLLNDVLQLKLGVDSERACADYANLSLVVKTESGKAYTVASLTKRDDDEGTMRFKAILDVPMLHYGTALTFGIYRDGQLVSDELVYGAGCYAGRIYGQNEKQDAVLDAMLTLGDAATAYRYGVENAVSQKAGVPAKPGSTVDLGCYPLSINGAIIPAGKVNWLPACAALGNAIVGGRYVQAPTAAGVYRMVAKHEGKVYSIPLVVCDESGHYPAPVAEASPFAEVDLSTFGALGTAASTGLPAYWRWALNTVSYNVKKNEATVSDTSKLATFLFLTDMHWEQNARNTIKVANYLQAELGFDQLLFGGDAIDGHAGIETAAATMADWLAAMNTFHGTWYATRGNHDQNASWMPETLDDVWTDDEYYDNVLQYAGNAREDGSKKLYNYVDDPITRIRYYILADDSAGLTADGRDTSLKEGVNAVSYDEQLRWLQETAATLDDGWGIVVMQHRLFSGLDAATGVPSTNEFYAKLIPVLNEIDKTNEVLAVFSGHTHWDASIQTEGGYYVISTTNDGGAADPYLPPLKAGTNQEQRMDVVQIDRENRKVYLTRVGGGYNREFTY